MNVWNNAVDSDQLKMEWMRKMTGLVCKWSVMKKDKPL
jgi:hypothetical protein